MLPRGQVNEDRELPFRSCLMGVSGDFDEGSYVGVMGAEEHWWGRIQQREREEGSVDSK